MPEPDLRTPYREDEEVEVGDLVELFDGAFGVGIVVKIEADRGWRAPMAHLERPMAAVYGVAPCSASLEVERLSISCKVLKSRYKVYRRGGRKSADKDNRWRGQH